MFKGIVAMGFVLGFLSGLRLLPKGRESSVYL